MKTVDVQRSGASDGIRQAALVDRLRNQGVDGARVELIEGGQLVQVVPVDGEDPVIPSACEIVARYIRERALQPPRVDTLREQLPQESIHHVAADDPRVIRPSNPEPGRMRDGELCHHPPAGEEAGRLAGKPEPLRKLGEEGEGRCEPSGDAPVVALLEQRVAHLSLGNPQMRRMPEGARTFGHLRKEAIGAGFPEDAV